MRASLVHGTQRGRVALCNVGGLQPRKKKPHDRDDSRGATIGVADLSLLRFLELEKFPNSRKLPDMIESDILVSVNKGVLRSLVHHNVLWLLTQGAPYLTRKVTSSVKTELHPDEQSHGPSTQTCHLLKRDWHYDDFG